MEACWHEFKSSSLRCCESGLLFFIKDDVLVFLHCQPKRFGVVWTTTLKFGCSVTIYQECYYAWIFGPQGNCWWDQLCAAVLIMMCPWPLLLKFYIGELIVKMPLPSLEARSGFWFHARNRELVVLILV